LSPKPCLLPQSDEVAENVEEETTRKEVMTLDEHEELEERVQALTEKVEKLERIVYWIWKDLKGIVNNRHRQAEL
jgi:hypothetical protein